MTSPHNSSALSGKSAFPTAVRSQQALLDKIADGLPADVAPVVIEAKPRPVRFEEELAASPPERKDYAPKKSQYEELTLSLDKWVFKFRTPYVCDNEFSFSFGVDEDTVVISPMFEAGAKITYKGEEFPITFAGGNLKLPGIPFTILSFLKLGAQNA